MSRERVNPALTETERAQEAAAVWFARLRGPRISKSDRAEFESWLTADESHRREFATLEQIWNETGRLTRKKRVGRRATRAILSLVTIAVFGAWLSADWFAGRIVTRAGDRYHTQLADGSQLDVAPRTRVRVEFDTTLRRLVLEEGRIAVSVAADAQRPFHIVAKDGVIRDIGTRFEVQADPERVRVTVADGTVEISSGEKAGSVSRRLDGGHEAEYDQGGVTAPRAVDTAVALAWTRGQLVFDAVPLADVIVALNRFRGTPIELNDSRLAQIRISGVFLIDDEAATLRALEQVVPVTFERGWGKVTARRRTG